MRFILEVKFASDSEDKKVGGRVVFFRFADYCVLHYMDGKCDLQCAVAECGFDGFDCGGNANVYLADSSIVGIIFYGSPVKILERIYPLLAKLAQVNC